MGRIIGLLFLGTFLRLFSPEIGECQTFSDATEGINENSGESEEENENEEAETDDLAWFYQKFGNASGYVDTTMFFTEESMTDQQFEAMLKHVETANTDHTVCSIMGKTLYRFAADSPQEVRYQKLKDRMYKAETLAKVADCTPHFSYNLTAEQLADKEMQKIAIRDCTNAVHAFSDFERGRDGGTDLWKKMPKSVLMENAQIFLACAKDAKGFFEENEFARNAAFVTAHLESLPGEQWHFYLKKLYESLPLALKGDKLLAAKFFARNADIYPILAEKLKKDLSLAQLAVAVNPLSDESGKEIIYSFPDNIKMAKPVLRKVRDKSLARFLAPALRANSDSLNELLEISPFIYEFALEPAKSDPKTVIAVCEQNADLFAFAPDKLKTDIKFLRQLVVVAPKTYRYFPDPVRGDPETAQFAFRADPRNLAHAPEALLENTALVKSTVEHAASVKVCPLPESEKIRSNGKLMVDLMKANPFCSSLLTEEMFTNEMFQALVSSDFHFGALKKMPDKYRSDPDLLNGLGDNNRMGFLKWGIITTSLISDYIGKYGVERFKAVYGRGVISSADRIDETTDFDGRPGYDGSSSHFLEAESAEGESADEDEESDDGYGSYYDEDGAGSRSSEPKNSDYADVANVFDPMLSNPHIWGEFATVIREKPSECGAFIGFFREMSEKFNVLKTQEEIVYLRSGCPR